MKFNKDDVYEMLASLLEVDVDLVKNINEDEDFQVHGMNSISAIQLVVMLEGKYDFEFRDEDLLINKFNTYKKLYDLLESY